jgi:hypothetical protein
VNVVVRSERETPGRRACHFCDWALVVTEVDLKGDTVDAYDRHLRRHAEAATVADFESAIFDELARQLDTP